MQLSGYADRETPDQAGRYRVKVTAPRLHLVAAENVVLFPAWALRAPEATNQQNRDPGRDNHGQKDPARHEPMDQTMHTSHHYNEPDYVRCRFPRACVTSRRELDGI